MNKALELIATERQRHVDREGWDQAHDDLHTEGELSIAAACYAMPHDKRRIVAGVNVPAAWPWENMYWKPTPEDRIKELVKAGALIVAEIERLERLKHQQ